MLLNIKITNITTIVFELLAEGELTTFAMGTFATSASAAATDVAMLATAAVPHIPN